jgi:hypothetical protein
MASPLHPTPYTLHPTPYTLSLSHLILEFLELPLLARNERVQVLNRLGAVFQLLLRGLLLTVPPLSLLLCFGVRGYGKGLRVWGSGLNGFGFRVSGLGSRVLV